MPAPPPPGKNQTRIDRIDYSGNLGTIMCLPNGVDSCGGLYLTNPHDAVKILNVTGIPTHVQIRLEWDASSPFTDSLWVGIYKAKLQPCEGGTCYETQRINATEGPSPLSLDETVTWGDEEALRIWIHETTSTPSPVFAMVHPEQEFHITGKIEAMAPENATREV